MTILYIMSLMFIVASATMMLNANKMMKDGDIRPHNFMIHAISGLLTILSGIGLIATATVMLVDAYLS